jgi:ComF family protein
MAGILSFACDSRGARAGRGAEAGREGRRILLGRFAGCQPGMAGRVDRHLERLGGWLLPPRCVLCGDRGQRPCLDLCVDCEAALPPADPVLEAGTGPLLRSIAAFDYRHPVDFLVHSLKYRGRLANGRVLGSLLARRVAPFADAVDVVLPVPLHPHRHAERGFNQSLEIAQRVARALERPVRADLARRLRDTRPQVGLDPVDRRVNLAGAFAARGVAGLRLAVVDDVTTTGSTLRELAAALVGAGARTVEAWCVARAVPHGIRSPATGEASPGAERMG